MSKGIWILGVVFLFAGSAFALDFMGPPTATLDRGQMKAGFAYSFSETDIDTEVFDVDLGVLEDVQITRYYGIFNAGIMREWEVYAMIGSGDAEVDWFNGSNELAYGFGTKITFWHFNECWEIGGLAQISFFNVDREVSGTLDIGNGNILAGSADLEIENAYELQIAVGPTVSLTENFRIYGGPFFYALNGDLEIDGEGTLNGNPITESWTIDLEETENFGGYIGTQILLGESTELEVEYLATSDAWGVGASIGWKF